MWQFCSHICRSTAFGQHSSALEATSLRLLCAAQNLCNMIWGMARLAEHPGEELMAVYRQRQDRILYDPRRSKADTEQALTNVLWAMAVLDELDADMATEVGRASCRTLFFTPLIAHLFTK